MDLTFQQTPNDNLSINEYQKLAIETASYPDRGSNMIYPVLGLVGEAGETADKIKKFYRNLGITDAKKLNTEQKLGLAKEMGDVLWYLAALADELEIDLSYIAQLNIEKLYDRKARGVIKSEGDNR